MAFIFAGIVFVVTLVICAFMILAAGMSDNPSMADDVGKQATGVLITGLIIAALLVLSHYFYLPHIGW